jgi:hypothetical protein
MAGRAARRATLAARPAQAVTSPPSPASSFPQCRGAQCERCALLDLCHSQTLCSVRVLIITGFAIWGRCKVALGGAASMMIALEARAGAKPFSILDICGGPGPIRSVAVRHNLWSHRPARPSRLYAFEDEARLSRFVRRVLLRRRSAKRRIGVSQVGVKASPLVLPLLAQFSLTIRLPPAPELGGLPQSRQE